MASLERAEKCIATSSGCSATVLVTHLLKTGDHIICVDDVYGGTGRYFRKMAVPIYGMEVDFVDMTSMDSLRAGIKENTKLCWIETPTNPTLKVMDIQAIAEVCKEKGIILVVDNTFQTPYFQRPLTLGADIVIHSATKYIGGHSDFVMGFILTNNEELYHQMYLFGYSLGPIPGPMDCYLALRSIKTLGVRIDAIFKNAQTVAEHLETRTDIIERVYYTCLPSHP